MSELDQDALEAAGEAFHAADAGEKIEAATHAYLSSVSPMPRVEDWVEVVAEAVSQCDAYSHHSPVGSRKIAEAALAALSPLLSRLGGTEPEFTATYIGNGNWRLGASTATPTAEE